MVMAHAVLVAPPASFTCTLNVPEPVGVPVIAPVVVFSTSPAGSVPTIEYVYGAVPPETVIAPELNATPASPVVTAGHNTDSCGLMVMAHAVLVAPPASFTCT